MSREFNQKVIAAKIETVVGTDAAPDGTNAILARNVQPRILEADEITRDFAQNYLGNTELGYTNLRSSLSFEVELAGSGTAGTAPAYGPLLRACGFQEVINVGTDVTYNPVSGGFEACTIHFEQDGDLHKMQACRGSVDFVIPRNAYPFLRFNFIGLYNDPVTGTIATPDFSGFQDPVEVNFDNTPTAQLHGQDVVLQSLELSMGNDVGLRNLPGQKEVRLKDRSPSGQMIFDAPAVATFNYFTRVPARTTGALSLTHGTVAGNIVELSAPKVQLKPMEYSDDENVLSLTTPLHPLPLVGDDEIRLVVK